MKKTMTMTVSEAAKIIGVTATTIRNWEKAGLITPIRSSNGYRLFDGNSLKQLMKIKELSIEQGYNITTIKSLIGRDNFIKNTSSETITKAILGKKWKNHRLKKGLSLSEVSEATNISVSYLDKIETAKANVSYNLLERLAKFYGENPLLYFEPQVSEDLQASFNLKENLKIGLKGVTLTSCSALQNSGISVMIYDIEPLCGRIEPNSHHGEEFIFILDGEIEFQLENQTYILAKNDTLHYFSSIPHSWKNISNKNKAKMLWIYKREGEI